MIKLGVIYGGKSTEHDISEMSAKSVIENLNKEKYEVHEIYINKYGKWFENKNGQIEEIYNLLWTLKELDVVFPVLHGKYGEDGTIQGMLEMLGIPYVGCGVLASAIGMDKAYTKIIFERAGIPQTKYIYIRKRENGYYMVNDNFEEEELKIEKITSKLKFPMFVKPSNSGSSVGVKKVTTIEELKSAIENAQQYDNKILIEEEIVGKEVECAILEDEKINVSTVGEIKSAEEYYSFDAKYNIPESKTIIPAEIANDEAQRIKELAIENPVDQRTSLTLVGIKPEPIPLDLKVLIIGNSNIYHTLLSMDDDFRKLFKIKVEFEEDAPKTNENIERLSKFVRSFCEQEGLLDLDKEAMAKVVEFTSKLAGDKEKLSTQFSEIGEIVGEASTWAKLDKSKIITKEYVKKALDERIDRIKKYDEKYLQMIKDEALLIETDGYKIGQINGLTVITIGDYSFGKPAKITANTYMGQNGIVNIEREVEMSGSSHSKGVLILTGYLGEQFAQDMPLSLTASICFEQLYGGVDGDSASSTEAYAILSSLSGIPINQSIAVTGSVNQKGEIQPIGGVNEKIEGFYQICKMRGLNGESGVIIPTQNVRNLHLSDEIIDSVRKGKFHIYAVKTIDEGIEILTGVPAGKKDKNGKFPLGTINYLAYEKLKKFSKIGENKSKN